MRGFGSIDLLIFLKSKVSSQFREVSKVEGIYYYFIVWITISGILREVSLNNNNNEEEYSLNSAKVIGKIMIFHNKKTDS